MDLREIYKEESTRIYYWIEIGSAELVIVKDVFQETGVVVKAAII